MKGRTGKPARRSQPAAGTGARAGARSSRARFAARAAAGRRRPRVLLAWSSAMLALAIGAGWVLGFSTLLVARTVQVEGVPAAQASLIRAKASAPLGRPLARVDTAVVAQRLLDIPTLAEVTVTRSYPSTLLVQATPRVPVLAVQEPGGQVRVVDKLGVAYAVVPRAPASVPLVLATQSPPTVDSLRTGIAVMRALPATQRASVVSVTVSSANLVTLKVRHQGRAVIVVWGGASDLNLKSRVMSALLAQKDIRSIDVSAPKSPVTT